MDKDSARQEVRQRWRDIIPTITGPAKTKVNGETSYICPFCGHGKSGDGLTFIPTEGEPTGLICFGCDFRGDILDLYMQRNQVSFPEALGELSAQIGIQIDDKAPRQPVADTRKASVPEPAEWPTEAPESAPQAPADVEPPKDLSAYYKACQARLGFPPAAAYLAGRGISAETAAAYGLGYDPDWSSPTARRNGKNPPSSPRIIIPTTAAHYIARDVRANLSDSQRQYSKMNEGPAGIFNARALYDPDAREVFVVEGAFDALSIIEAGAQAIAINSTGNADLLVRELEKKGTTATLILCLDNDNAGKGAEKKIRDGLTRLNISHITANISGSWKDPNEALQKDREAFESAIKTAQRQTAARPDSVSLYMDDLMAAEIDRFKVVTNTGFSNLDKESGGLYAGLYVVAAISSLGKTTFVHQMADQIAAAGNDVLFFSLEQSRLELVSKSIARITARNDMESAVTSLAIRRGHLPDNVLEAVKAYRASVGDRMSVIEGNFNCDILFIGDYIRQYINKTGCRPVVVIDYLQILQGAPQGWKQSTKEMIDSTVTELKRISREHDLTVFVISSVNRANYLTPIDFEALKESGGIEYTCDVVWGLQLQCLNNDMFDQANNIKQKRERVQEAKGATPRKIELRCLKNRYGRPNYSCFFDYYPANDLFTPGSDNDLDFTLIDPVPKAGRKR